MPNIDRRTLTQKELTALREKEREYKKNSRKKSGSLEIPVSKEMLSMIEKISKSLTLPPPASSTFGRMATISQVFEYLLKKETGSEFYKIKKNAPKRLFRLHNTVWYLKNIKGMNEEGIAELMTEKEELTPKAVFEGSKDRIWSEKTVKPLLDKEKVYDKIHKLNDE